MTTAQIISDIDDILYTWCLIYLLIGAGLYFTIRTGFVQIRLFRDSVKCMTEKKCSNDGVSSFQALMIATASRVGTGTWPALRPRSLSEGPARRFGCG